jgi:hypothetical protein
MKRSFDAVLEADAESRTPNATGVLIPFSVEEAFGTRGLVPVRGTINGHPFRSSLAPMGGGKHYLGVNRETREAARARAGESVRIVLEMDEEVREVTVPADLQRALKKDKAAADAWKALSYTNRKEWAREIEGAQRPETRERRLQKALLALRGPKAGKRN